MLDAIWLGLLHLFTIQNLAILVVGTASGMIIGAMPGLTATMAVALLVPFTFYMAPIPGLVMLGAIYMGAIYGGCFPAILINTPGTPSSIGTTFDGFPMARQGRGEEAIIGATVASSVGGVFGVLCLIFLSPLLAQVALQFGPAEYFWVGVFGITIISSLSSGAFLKGLIGGSLGMMISTIGIAPIGGDVRFTYGSIGMQAGVNLIVILVGMFCIPEVLNLIFQKKSTDDFTNETQGKGLLARTTRYVFSRPANLARSSVIGTVVGIIPGAGGNIANLVSYNEAKRASKEKEEFGKGKLDGVVATESANNAVVGGGLIPLLTLGIPGAPPDAIIYGALMMKGLNPGPGLFAEQADITYTFMVSIGVSALVMVPMGIYGGRYLARFVSRLPARLLVPGIVLLTIIGSYAIRNNFLDVYLMFFFGFAAYILRNFGFTAAPIVLGLILGPIMEEGLVQALLSGLEYTYPWFNLFVNPLSWILIAMSLASFLWPYFGPLKARFSGLR